MSSFSIAERVARLNETPAETAMRHEWQGQGNARPVAFHTAPARRNWFPLIAGAAIAAGFLLGMAAAAHACQIVVTDAKGDSFIAGEGDTAPDALQGAVYPAEWRSARFTCFPHSSAHDALCLQAGEAATCPLKLDALRYLAAESAGVTAR